MMGAPGEAEASAPIGPGVMVGKKTPYTIEQPLGKGGFGVVFSAVSDQGLQVAVKVSRKRPKKFRKEPSPPLAPDFGSFWDASTEICDSSSDDTYTIKDKLTGDIPPSSEVGLQTEYFALRRLEKFPGFPRPYELNVHGDETYLVMTRLGKSLRTLFEERGNSFTMATILKILDQVLLRLENLHSIGIVHGDLKPDNILLGLGEDAGKLYLIDFGLSTMYKNPKADRHLLFRINKNTAGTARYMSIHAHAKVQHSRRDDMESLGYVLSFFINRGFLPWRQEEMTPKGRMRRIFERKVHTTAETLFLFQPPLFTVFMKYVRRLDYRTEPEYARFRGEFRRLGAELGVNYEENFV